MTVSTNAVRNEHVGNGVTTVYPYSFKLFDEEDLYVEIDGVEKSLGADYTVGGVGEAAGGNITFAEAPDDGAEIVAYLDLEMSQPTDLKNQSSFYPRTIEAALDRAVLLVKQVQDRVDHSPAVAQAQAAAAEAEGHADDAAGSAGEAAASAALAAASASEWPVSVSRRLTAVADSGHLFTFDYAKVNEPIFGITNQTGEEGGWVQAVGDGSLLSVKFADLLLIGDSQAARVVTTIEGIKLVAGLSFVNKAVGGTTSTQALAQIAALVEAEKHPQVILVSTGTNDGWNGISLAQTKLNVLAIIAALRPLDSNIIWVGCPPVNLSLWDEYFTQSLVERNKELNEWMEGVARQFGFAFYNNMKLNSVDYDDDDLEWAYETQMSVDGIHMTQAAYYGMFLEVVRRNGTPFFLQSITVYSRPNEVTPGNMEIPTAIAVDWTATHRQHYNNLVGNSILELPVPPALPVAGSIGQPLTGGVNGVKIEITGPAGENSGVCAVFGNYGPTLAGVTPATMQSVIADGKLTTLRGLYLYVDGKPKFGIVSGTDAAATVGFRRFDEDGEILDTPVLFADTGEMVLALPVIIGSNADEQPLVLNGPSASTRALRIHADGVLTWVFGSGAADGFSLSHYIAGVLDDVVFEVGDDEDDPLNIHRPVELDRPLNLTGLPTHADEAAAVTAGRVTGDVYKTATGELRIKL